MENKPQKLWFKAKHYGYGWYPATWEGWLATGIFVLLLIIGELIFIAKLKASPSISVTAIFIVYILGLTSLLLYISYKKGEKPGWHWGKKK